MASAEDHEAQNPQQEPPNLIPERQNEDASSENRGKPNDSDQLEVMNSPELNSTQNRTDKAVSGQNLNSGQNNDEHQSSTSNQCQQAVVGNASGDDHAQRLDDLELPILALSSANPRQNEYDQRISQLSERVYEYDFETISVSHRQTFGIPTYQIASPENYFVASSPPNAYRGNFVQALQRFPGFSGFPSTFSTRPVYHAHQEILSPNTHRGLEDEDMLGNAFIVQEQYYPDAWISVMHEDQYYPSASTSQSFVPIPYFYQQANIVNLPCTCSNRNPSPAMRRSVYDNPGTSQGPMVIGNISQPTGSLNNPSHHNPDQFAFAVPHLPAGNRQVPINPVINTNGYRSVNRGSQEDIYYKDAPALPHPYYVQTLNQLVNEYIITILNPGRPGKKLLVLDMDFTLADFTKDYNPLHLARPYLHTFMAAVYADYDIAIWSATDMKMIKIKLRMLGIENNPHFKISFLLDITATVKCVHSSGRILIKPLELIWRRFDHYNKQNTIMVDDIKRNFLKNPANGIVIKPYYKYKNGQNDTELLKLITYLKRLALVKDVTIIDHHKWDQY